MIKLLDVLFCDGNPYLKEKISGVLISQCIVSKMKKKRKKIES